ncbi:MAG: hypothetical protein B6U72_02815 [Candidatus Altiarchaeales archaeon ex4484_2]|nr:MAG: hypothetical protein B6U72_02815 [Candidatus Altiarchaeales archaeon ex4484_2]
MEENKDMIEEDYIDLSGLSKHFEEPVLVVSILAFLLAALKVVFPSLEFGAIDIGLGKLSLYFIGTFFLGLLCIYFVYIYLKKEENRNYSLLLIPLLIFTTTIFMWYSDQGGGINERDFNILSVVSTTFLLFYSLSFHKVMKPSTALLTAIFLSTLFTHVAPAVTVQGINWSGKYLSALDPYYYYRHANTIVDTGFVPERETLVYPTDKPTFENSKFMVSVFMASITLILQPLGISTMDVAMVYAGVFAAFSSIVLYLLIRDLFLEYAPYNKAAALFAAFMLIFNPAFAAKAIAGNAEDDTLGLFLLIASYFLFILSYRKKSFKLSLISGFSFLLLNMTWSGYNFGFLVLCVFTIGYATINALQDLYLYIFHDRKRINRSYIEHLPYLVIPVVISNLFFIILHAQGGMPVFGFNEIPKYNLIAFGVAIALPLLLEMLRVYLSDRIIKDGRNYDSRINNFLQRNIYPISGVMLLGGIIFLVSFMDPVGILNYGVHVVTGAKQTEIIGMTTAEQNPLCSKIFTENCFMSLYATFGVVTVFALFSVFILAYYTFVSKKNLGPLFILCWSLPMIWGVVNKSQYQFTASIPIISLGATFALLLVMKREEWETLRVIPTILLIALPLVLTIGSHTPIVGAFGGRMPMDRGTEPGDIKYWYPALEWIGQQPENTTILTWWDYGHWISAISKRTSIADNTKKRRFIVQDLARFHVLEENETKALNIAKKYNATHVVIDYTMIGKSGAPHFIATSNLTAPVDDPNREGEHMSYGQCGFSPRNSQLEAKYEPNNEGVLVKRRYIVFTCNLGGDYREYIGAIRFEITNERKGDRITDIKISPVSRIGNQLMLENEISWSVWQNEKHGSILGIQSLRLILSNAINYKDNPQMYINFPTYKTLVYVPEKFNNYMMTRLYLGDHLQEYKSVGLADESIRPLEHFKLVDEFRGDSVEEFNLGKDKSYLGYVKTWEIDYRETISNNSETSDQLLT